MTCRECAKRVEREQKPLVEWRDRPADGRPCEMFACSEPATRIAAVYPHEGPRFRYAKRCRGHADYGPCPVHADDPTGWKRERARRTARRPKR